VQEGRHSGLTLYERLDPKQLKSNMGPLVTFGEVFWFVSLHKSAGPELLICSKQVWSIDSPSHLVKLNRIGSKHPIPSSPRRVAGAG
jgi:hypothetical protein